MNGMEMMLKAMGFEPEKIVGQFAPQIQQGLELARSIDKRLELLLSSMANLYRQGVEDCAKLDALECKLARIERVLNERHEYGYGTSEHAAGSHTNGHGGGHFERIADQSSAQDAGSS